MGDISLGIVENAQFLNLFVDGSYPTLVLNTQIEVFFQRRAQILIAPRLAPLLHRVAVLSNGSRLWLDICIMAGASMFRLHVHFGFDGF